MPKTPPTIPAPLPTDHRLLSLARLLKVSRRDALGATVDAWAWIQAQATDGIVPEPVVLLDTVAEIEGYGEAAVAVGLVGTADGHIVAPAELRHHAAQPGAARGAGPADDDARDRERRQARDRQRRRRNGTRLTGKQKAPFAPSPASATSTTPSRRARRLGTVAPGFDVMLLWSKRNECWFYKCTGATPDLTGTVTDQGNPTLADALKALLDARLTQTQQASGKLSQPVFHPSMEQLVAAARRERDERQAAAAADARVDAGNDALDRAADDDADQGDNEPAEPVTPTADAPPEDVAERDCHAAVTHVTRDTVTCHALVTRDIDASTLQGNDLDTVFCHAAVTVAPPSSSSSMSSLNEETKKTTTTSGTADHERDAQGGIEQDDIFARYLRPADTPTPDLDPLPPLSRDIDALVQRLADALNSSPDAIRHQGRRHPEVLLARCHAAGIDPKTGHPVAARDARTGAYTPTSPQDAPGSPQDTGTGVHEQTSVHPSGGVLGASAAKPARLPCSGDRTRSGIVQPFPADHAVDERDHGRDIEPAGGTARKRRPDANDDDIERRRAEALRMLSALG